MAAPGDNVVETAMKIRAAPASQSGMSGSIQAGPVPLKSEP
jgi:hypothetical protein